MKITLAKDAEYIPEWNGNREDPEPVVFHLRYLTTAERQQCMEKEYLPDKDGGIRVAVKPDQERMFKLAVKKIEHLEVNGRELVTAKEVLETPGLDSLFLEVSLHVLTMNAEQDSKN